MNTEKVRANEELKNLKNNHSIECNTYKTNLEECFKEIANLKSEVLLTTIYCQNVKLLFKIL